MTERESDIEFDFFDEPATEEAAERHRISRRAPRPGGPRRPVRPPSGLVPLLRLAGLVAFLILLAVVLVFAINSCQSSSKENAYSTYMQAVKGIASRSTLIGRDLSRELAKPGLKETQLETTLDGLAQQQQQAVAQAQTLEPPGPLRAVHGHLIEALQLRASGLGRLADAFRQTAGAGNANVSGRRLAQQAQLLAASDVNWDFYFKVPAIQVLREQNVHAAVPDSNIFPNVDLASSRSLGFVWQRLHGAATGGTPAGNHGSALGSVKQLPSGSELTTGSVNTVIASTDLKFQVAVQDSGDFQESTVHVTLTIAESPRPIVKTATIAIINAGETRSVQFGNFGDLPFGVRTTVKVDIQPVPGEKTVKNNSAEYPVIFSLG
jgi:hypothetical protein